MDSMGREDHSETTLENRTESYRSTWGQRFRAETRADTSLLTPRIRTVLDEFKEHREGTSDVGDPPKVLGLRPSREAWLRAGHPASSSGAAGLGSGRQWGGAFQGF